MKQIWNKKSSKKTDDLVSSFTIGNDRQLDLYLAEADVIGNIAHIKMLCETGLVSEEEKDNLVKELLAIYDRIQKNDFAIEEGVEDIHSQIEYMLTTKLGDAGKRIHTGRSRNDQVLLDIKLFTRQRIKQIVDKANAVFHRLIDLSNEHKDVLIPGYTHLQVAMPSSFGLWFGAFAESLVDDLILLKAAYDINQQNPLGSGAGYGSSFPLKREITTKLLGFNDMAYNVVYAQMGRGKVEKTTCFALSSIGTTIAKFAMDACLYMSQNFGFISLPEEFTTGSSIMPHKKNPDVFELLRAKGNAFKSLPMQIDMITGNLPSGYHRDLQLLKELYIPAIEELLESLDMLNFILNHIIINKNIIDDDKYKYAFSVDEVDKKVSQGIPFRNAYEAVGEEIIKGTFNPERKTRHTMEGSINNLCNDKIIQKMDRVIESFHFEKAEQAISALLANR
jgi:argininosuccinate lyase